MLHSFNQVFVGKYAANTSNNVVTNGALGDIFLTNMKGLAPAAGDPFYVNQIIGDEVFGPTGQTVKRIRTSFLIDPKRIVDKAKAKTNNAYVAPANQITTVDITNATIYSRDRVVVRLQYKDLFQYGAQPAVFSQSFEVFGNEVAVVNDVANNSQLVTLLINRINSNPQSRVIAANGTATSFTITGRDTQDNHGVDSLNDYHQVQFTTSIYKTDLFDSTLYNNYYEGIPGTTVNVTPCVQPNGFWKQARDAERHGLAGQGVYDLTSFPVIKPQMFTDPTATYSVFSIDVDSQVDAADLSVKNNPLNLTLYVTSATAAALTTLLSTAIGS